MGILRAKFCADTYSAGNPQPTRSDVENLFHSDFSTDTFYTLFSESLENINKWLVKTIWRKKFGVNYDSQQSTPKTTVLPKNKKVYLTATLVGLERSLNISRPCICSCWIQSWCLLYSIYWSKGVRADSQNPGCPDMSLKCPKCPFPSKLILSSNFN